MDTIIQDALGKEWCLSLKKITWVLPLLIENKLNPRSWQVSKFTTSSVHALGIETKTSKFEGQICHRFINREKRIKEIKAAIMSLFVIDISCCYHLV